MNKLKGLITGVNIKKSLCLQMFDQLVYPITTYGCEIWGVQDFSVLLKPNSNVTLEDIYEKLPQEKLHIHFCKYILGVSAKATNFAVMSELGRYPLYSRIITQMVKYYLRIKNMEEGTLLKEALLEMQKRDKKSWLKTPGLKLWMNSF